METEKRISIKQYFEDLPDQRKQKGKRHKLIDIITIAICAVICGADDWASIEGYGNAKQDWLETFLELPHGIPSHDTIGRVFSWLEPEAFQTRFLEWVKAVVKETEGEVIAIDGKKLRRSHDRTNGKDAIWMVSAWAKENQLVLGQVKVDEKSNEITAIPTLLDVLDLNNCIVTIDAMGCQHEIANQIVEKGGDYVLSLKENQGNLYEDACALFDGAVEVEFHDVEFTDGKQVNKNHGRIEVRKCWSITDRDFIHYLRGYENWNGLRSIVKVRCRRITSSGESEEDRYFISSLRTPANHILSVIRGHWHIENSLHWVLDTAFREDDSRVRKDHAPQNFAMLRHIAMNLLKKDKCVKLGVKNKRLTAAWDNKYLLRLLNS